MGGDWEREEIVKTGISGKSHPCSSNTNKTFIWLKSTRVKNIKDGFLCLPPNLTFSVKHCLMT